MFIFLGYVSLALIQLYKQFRRQRQYASAMLRAVRTGSVLVQRGKSVQHGSVGALLNSSLLTCTQSYKETQLVCDEHLAVSVVSPKQKVDLTGWTSYLDIHPAHDSSGSVVCLLEAGRPENLDAFVKSACQVPLAYQVHVLKHGCPIAWKSGTPFGIILHCSYNDFVLLCDAFGQGQLTLDEDLELYRMITVSTVGKPSHLKRPCSVASGMLMEQDNSQATETESSPLLSTASSEPLLYPATDRRPLLLKAQPIKTSAPEISVSGNSVSPLSSSPQPTATGTGFSKTSMSSDVSAAVLQSGKERSQSSPHPVKENGETYSIGKTGDKKSSDFTEAKVASSEKQLHDSTDFKSANGEISRKASDGFSSSQRSDVSMTLDTSPQLVKSPAQSSESLMSSRQSLSAQSTGKSSPLDSASLASDEGSVNESKGKKMETKAPITTESLKTPQSAKSTETMSQSVAAKSESLTPTSVNAKSQSPSSVKISPSPSLSKPPKTEFAPSKSPSTSSNGMNGANGIQSANGTPGPADAIKKTKDTNGANGTEDGNKVNGSSDDKMFSKPPNIVVYCGNKDTARKFEMIKAGLEQCLNTDAYTIYLLPHEEFMSLPWEDNCAALIISHDYLHDNIGKKCTEYLLKGGRVVSFGSSIEAEFVLRKEVQKRPSVAKFGLEKWRDVSAIQGRYHYVRNNLKKDNSSMDALVVDPKTSEPLVIQLMLSADHGNGRAIFSQIFLERDPTEMAVDSKTFSSLKQSNPKRLEVLRHLLSLLDLDTSVSPPPALTPCYMLAQDQTLTKTLLDVIASRMKQGVIKSRSLSLSFVSIKTGASSLKATNDTLPIVTDLDPSSAGDTKSLTYFDPQVYWSNLTSSVYGRVVFYTEVIPTTMTIFEGIQFSIPEKLGVVAIAGRQTSGKGRGGNMWLSPIGCAMFTMPVQVAASSTLGQRVSFLQHIASYAVVHSIRSMPGYQKLDLRLKWPNDIYYGNKMKLGGVLVTSTVMGNTMHAVIGCGVNVSNSQPTICINDIIQQHNTEHGTSLRTLTTSEVLARTMSAMEEAMAQFQDKGHLHFCQQYYKYWLHSGAQVKVESEGNAEVKILGLDDFGFLRVVNSQGQQLSVQPDGNSFDMLRNLIATKRE